MIIKELENKGLIAPPPWLSTNVHLLTIMGSVAYGVSSDTSDMDIYGFCTPKKETVFPHLAGEILGFGTQIPRFDQWQKHHVFDQSQLAGKGRTYDFTVFSIVRYFQLLMDNNPNVIDSIFTPQECILHITEVGTMVREARHMFLSQQMYPKFKGYAYAQLHKMTSKEPTGKRVAIREEFGFDVKFAYHLVRLLNECEQLLKFGTLDLRQNNEQLKAIRRGEVPEEDIRKWASDKEKQLEQLYTETKLPVKPNETQLKELLLRCLEHHYGNLEKAIVVPDRYYHVLTQIKDMVNEVV
jgi:uncharacterized protein